MEQVRVYAYNMIPFIFFYLVLLISKGYCSWQNDQRKIFLLVIQGWEDGWRDSIFLLILAELSISRGLFLEALNLNSPFLIDKKNLNLLWHVIDDTKNASNVYLKKDNIFFQVTQKGMFLTEKKRTSMANNFS